jgi:hypothetical protein
VFFASVVFFFAYPQDMDERCEDEKCTMYHEHVRWEPGPPQDEMFRLKYTHGHLDICLQKSGSARHRVKSRVDNEGVNETNLQVDLSSECSLGTNFGSRKDSNISAITYRKNTGAAKPVLAH